MRPSAAATASKPSSSHSSRNSGGSTGPAAAAASSSSSGGSASRRPASPPQSGSGASLSQAPGASGSGAGAGSGSGSGSGIASSSNAIWDNFLEADNQEDELEDKDYASNNRDSIVCLVDCSEKMYQRDENGEILLHSALRTIVNLLTNKIISSESDLIGVCFYNTRDKKNLNDFEGVMVFQDLDVPDARRIMDLDDLVNTLAADPTDEDSVAPRLPFGLFGGEFPISEAFWTCLTMFQSSSVKQGTRRVFLFTCEDNPHSANAFLREQAIVKGKDLADQNIELEPMFMNAAGQTFDPTRFYQNIVPVSDDEDTGVLQMRSAKRFEELQESIRRKAHKKRALTRLSFFIAPNVEIGARLYNLVSETKKGQPQHLDGDGHQPLKTVTKWICEETGALLLPQQIKFAYSYGGERVIFEKEEIQQIKSIDARPGLQLMGFKALDKLKIHHNIRHSNFLYPDETMVKGSMTLFAALLDRMLAQQKIAIARLTPRLSAPPRFVALVPQVERYDQDNLQSTPAGFSVIHLPYSDDLRKLTLPATKTATDEQIDAAVKLVKTCRIKFDSKNHENPVLQKYYTNLQQLALENRKPVEKEVNDTTMPDMEGFAASPVKEVIHEFIQAVYGDTPYNPVASAGKRKSAADGGEPPKRRRALEGTPEETVRAGHAEKLTIADLKALLNGRGLKGLSSKKKPELVALAEQMIGVDRNNNNDNNNDNNNNNDANNDEANNGEMAAAPSSSRSRNLDDD